MPRPARPARRRRFDTGILLSCAHKLPLTFNLNIILERSSLPVFLNKKTRISGKYKTPVSLLLGLLNKHMGS